MPEGKETLRELAEKRVATVAAKTVTEVIVAGDKSQEELLNREEDILMGNQVIGKENGEITPIKEDVERES